MSATKRILKSLFTERDNESQDMMKWLAAISFLIAMGLTIFEVVIRLREFDIMVFATGVGALMAVLTGALRWKDPVVPAAPITPPLVAAPTPDKVTEVTQVTSTTTSTITPPPQA